MSDPVVLTPGDGIGPTVAGKNPADPTASLCSTVLMLRHLKMNDVAVRVMTVIRQTLSDAIRTHDVGATPAPPSTPRPLSRGSSVDRAIQ